MANILILGGDGFIGRNLIKVLNGHTIHIYDPNVKSKSNVSSEIRFHQGCIYQINNLISILDKHKIDIVIHLASGLLPGSSFKEYLNEYSLIILPTIKLLKHLPSRKIKLIFFSSGGTIYGNTSQNKVTENHNTSPICYYGLSKKIMEDLILFENREFGLEYLILRPSNIYGPGQKMNGTQGLIATSIRKVLSGEKIVVWGDGTTIRDYLYIDDLCFVINELIAINPKNEILNISSGVGYTINEVLDEIKLHIGRNMEIEFSQVRNVDVADIILDNSKLMRIVPFQPISLKMGIKNFMGYLKIEHE